MAERPKGRRWKRRISERVSWVRPVMRPGARGSSPGESHPPIKVFLMYYVYFLQLSNSDIYKGMTEDLKRRVYEHKNGKVESTRNYSPIILVGYEAYQLKSDAQRREKFLKTTEGKKLFRRQYRDILMVKK